VRHRSGLPMGIEYASVQVVRKPARAWFAGENLIGPNP